MRKKHRISNLFVTFCFLAFLFTAMVTTVVRGKSDYSFFENRMLATVPEYTPEGDGDGSYVNQWEKYLSDHVALRNTLLKVKTWMDLALRRPVVNDVVIGDGILLPYLPAGPVDRDDITYHAYMMADNLKKINSVVASYGGYYCYVCVPCQYDYYADRYPGFLNNGKEKTRLSLDMLSQAMAAEGVDFLDLTGVFEELGHPDGYSSVVDNHYSMQGAFLCYQKIMEHVVERTGLDIPIYRDEDVNITELPNPYLGSRERKLLGLVDLEEKLYVLHPKEKWVALSRTDNGERGKKSVYALPQNEWDQLTYDLYMGGDIAETRVNTGRRNMHSVLIYGDSMTNAMECVLYLSFDKMYSLDLRHYKDMSITDYIDMVKPDVVLCIRDPEALLELTENGGMILPEEP